MKLIEIKQVIYKRFGVSNTYELKNSPQFNMAIDGMEVLNLKSRNTWESMYRKWIGILPYETNQEGYGCINGINIFTYFMPWKVFNLDPKTSSKKDIKRAFYELSKVYHPNNKETGDEVIFNRLNQMYKSLISGIKE